MRQHHHRPVADGVGVHETAGPSSCIRRPLAARRRDGALSASYSGRTVPRIMYYDIDVRNVDERR